jgi:hypothetical protein
MKGTMKENNNKKKENTEDTKSKDKMKFSKKYFRSAFHLLSYSMYFLPEVSSRIFNFNFLKLMR